MPTVLHNSAGNYRFLGQPGRPFSGGVAADTDFDIVHTTFGRPVSLSDGIDAALEHVTRQGRPVLAIAGFELRIPKPFSRAGFEEFNDGYIDKLTEVGLSVDGLMPAARTNVSPEVGAPKAPSVYAVSYTIDAPGQKSRFVISGAAEAVKGDPAARLDSIIEQLTASISQLGVSWEDASMIQLYGMDLSPAAVVESILRPLDGGAVHGIRWFPSHPPIDDLTLEVDVRSASKELII
jgi:hypothetical protein